jgi:hypothetical protein
LNLYYLAIFLFLFYEKHLRWWEWDRTNLNTQKCLKIYLYLPLLKALAQLKPGTAGWKTCLFTTRPVNYRIELLIHKHKMT